MQAHQSSQQQQQQHQPPSAGAVTSDPAKAAAAAASVGNMKGLPSPGLLQAAQFAAAAAAAASGGGGNPHTLVSAAFPYMHAMSSSMQSVPVKPPDQKPAAA
ncbi:hypothetical protein QJS10_CPB22g01319 [Acorus calamus]|uniref:Uncharacterized protein n=1 Tax=Acorus calamus TaxID=4465 RepID=A0AAV9C0M2_ACOCL|nr:hypothetical protein QJS10_CPB22g01319 [Acorus calamus]